MATVALDASALMLPVELDVRLFEELERHLGTVEAIVPAVVVAELRGLAGGGGTSGRAAAVGLELLDRECTVVSTANDPADDALLELVLSGRAGYLVTADRALIDRATEVGVATVAPRGTDRLVVHEP